MVPVAGGTFDMGSTTGGSNEQPVHSVTLSPFYMGKYEVTQEQYKAVIGNNPSGFTTGADAGEIQAKRPVETVSWYDALVFCNTLSVTEGLTPAYSVGGSTNPADWGSVPTSSNAAWDTVVCNWSANGYRLPTEAEWEYAARGGNSSHGYTHSGGNEGDINTIAWYNGNSGSKTHEVGKKAANELGLYDMSGNVWEWCWDWYGGYTIAAQINPQGAPSGSGRVRRGGGWADSAVSARSAWRLYTDPSYRYYTPGFRVVRPQF